LTSSSTFPESFTLEALASAVVVAKVIVFVSALSVIICA
jgi:hypothetical protein